MDTPRQDVDTTAPESSAVADSKTDDSAALQRAVDSLAGSGEVILPSGEVLRFERGKKPDA